MSDTDNAADRIVRSLLNDARIVKIHGIDEKVLWGALCQLSAMVRDAKPMIEWDQMVADLSRFAPLAPEDQAELDRTEYQSELWLAEYKRLTEPK